MELALWSLLGPRAVTLLSWESFGAGWVTDVVKQLKLEAEVRTAGYGEIATSQFDPGNDIGFTWTEHHVVRAQTRFIAADRTGLRFAMRLGRSLRHRWPKIVSHLHWPKVGGEGGHG